MPKTMITENGAFLRLILDNACALTEDEFGVKVFYIETHCVAWKVEAFKKDGEWRVLTMTSEPC